MVQLTMSFRFIFLSLCLVSVTAAESWPQFRGPNATAAIDGATFPLEWSSDQNVKWKTELPGPGSSSPIFWENKLFVTCYTGYGTDEKEIGEPEELGRQLLCLDRASGKILWTKSIPLANPEDDYRGYLTEHGYASPTPVTDGTNVYAFFGKSGVHVFTIGGEKVWSKPVGDSSSNRRWGSAASPVLYGDLLIVNAADEAKTIFAYDKNSGKEKWRYESDQLELTYNTPTLHTPANGKTELVIAAPDELFALDPKTGKKFWWAESEIPGNISPAVISEGELLFTTGGYPKKGSLVIKGGGSGDVTDQILWKSKTFSYVPSSVVKDGLLYCVNDEASVIVMDLKSGETVTQRKVEAIKKRKKFSFYASILRVDDQLIAQSRRNGLFIFKANKEMALVRINTLDDDSDFNATPALTKDAIYLRSNKALYCIAK
ncbi:PQQ-like beta-propeller repeat protein [Akkermansiaceae bacterium]|nr:PQQ-like beta-propeller repeat protein [Akkermansiaceae bacterium]